MKKEKKKDGKTRGTIFIPVYQDSEATRAPVTICPDVRPRDRPLLLLSLLK